MAPMMHRNFTYFLIANICFLFGCSDPLELEISAENDAKIHNGASRFLFPSMSLHDWKSISEAQDNLGIAWGYLDKLDAGTDGMLAMCGEDVLSTYKMLREYGRMGPIVPAGTTYAQLMWLHDSKLAEPIIDLLDYHFESCRLGAAVIENRRVSVRAIPPKPETMSEMSARYDAIERGEKIPKRSKPSELLITNNSDESIGKGDIEWRIYVSGREQPIATGRTPTTFIGGLEVGESAKQYWGANKFQAWNEIRQAAEVFGENQLLMRACFTDSVIGHCINMEDELAVTLVELAVTTEELRVIRAEIFGRETEAVRPAATKT